jgi:hypothetical protein
VPKASPIKANHNVNKLSMILLNDINVLPLCYRSSAEDLRAPRTTAAQLVIAHIVFMLLNHGAHSLLHPS